LSSTDLVQLLVQLLVLNYMGAQLQ